MQASFSLKRQYHCRWDLLRCISKDYFNDLDSEGHVRVISFKDGYNMEQMIFLTRDPIIDKFIVVTKKMSRDQKYVPHIFDNYDCYEDYFYFVKFIFTKYEDAIEFLIGLPFYHKEFYAPTCIAY